VGSALLPACDRQLVSCLLACSVLCVRQEARHLTHTLATLPKDGKGGGAGGGRAALPFEAEYGQRKRKAVSGAGGRAVGAAAAGQAEHSGGGGGAYFVSGLDAGLVAAVALHSMNFHHGECMCVYVCVYVCSVVCRNLSVCLSVCLWMTVIYTGL
jgi:hypothetical protein